MGKLGLLLHIGRAFGVRGGVAAWVIKLQRGCGVMSRRMRSAKGCTVGCKRIAPNVAPVDLISIRRDGGRAFFFSNSQIWQQS